VVLASVFKVPIAAELARQFDAKMLDPEERIRVPKERRTTGPTGLSVMADEVELSLRDLARLMITVSDNTATDIIMERLGREAINDNLRRLGLSNTFLEGDCRFLLDRLMKELQLSQQELQQVEKGEMAMEDLFASITPERWERCHDLNAESTNRSTPSDMTRLLDLLWKNEAASEDGCKFVREIMGQQVWPHRLRAGFPGSVKTSGKTGTLPFIRNEAGVIEYPDGGKYAVAVFTVAGDVRMEVPERDHVIGTLARIAVEELRRVA